MLKRSYQITRVMGIPIRVHITLIILLLYVAFRYGMSGILIAVGVFASVALHELGHSWVAIRKGCRVVEIMLMPIGGVAKMTSMPSRPMDEVLIAAAGPLVSLTLAVLFWLITSLQIFTGLFIVLTRINLMLCLFNLLPAFPMDGGRILRAWMTPRLGRLKATALAVKAGRLLAIAGGIFGLFQGDFFLILIAFFIYNAAGSEYRAVYAQQAADEWSAPEQQADVYVSPPPYAASSGQELKNKISTFLNNLAEKLKG